MSMSANSNFKSSMHPNKNLPPSQSMSQKRKHSSTKSKKYRQNFQRPLHTIPKTSSQNLKLNLSFILVHERQFLTISKGSQRSQTSPIPPNTIKWTLMLINPNLKAIWVRLKIPIFCSLKCEGHQMHQESETTTQIEAFSVKIKGGSGKKETIRA